MRQSPEQSVWYLEPSLNFDATAAGVLDSTLRIKDPTHASTFKIGALTYAGISNFHGLTIVDITDIAAPQQVTVYDVRLVENISSVVTFTTFTVVNGTQYAVSAHDNDIVFINISDVTFPSYHANITDDGIKYPKLDGSKQIVIGVWLLWDFIPICYSGSLR